jgi:hypothetical protein
MNFPVAVALKHRLVCHQVGFHFPAALPAMPYNPIAITVRWHHGMVDLTHFKLAPMIIPSRNDPALARIRSHTGGVVYSMKSCLRLKFSRRHGWLFPSPFL